MNLWLPLPGLPAASLWTAYVQSNLVGQAIVLLQIVMSVVVWSIMVGKWQELRSMHLIARRFRKVFDNSRESLEIFFQQRRSDNPMALVYQSACEKLTRTFSPEARDAVLGRREGIPGRALTARDLSLVKGATEQ